MQNTDTTQTQQNVIAYIDGFNLYFGMKKVVANEKKNGMYWLDVKALVESFLKEDQVLIRTNYFTSRIARNKDKQRRQNVYLEALEMLSPNVILHFGHYQSEPTGKCDNCGEPVYNTKEKMTDVNIATELILDAINDRFDVAILISGDSDLVPPVKAVLSHFPQKQIVVAFPPFRHSNFLEKIATSSFNIYVQRLRQKQLQLAIKKPGGTTIKCPDDWK